tara:strand:- start:2227 stop:2583 length:357 start_codon:yes stop_codon:yes gene_type:complete
MMEIGMSLLLTATVATFWLLWVRLPRTMPHTSEAAGRDDEQQARLARAIGARLGCPPDSVRLMEALPYVSLAEIATSVVAEDVLKAQDKELRRDPIPTASVGDTPIGDTNDEEFREWG